MLAAINSLRAIFALEVDDRDFNLRIMILQICTHTRGERKREKREGERRERGRERGERERERGERKRGEREGGERGEREGGREGEERRERGGERGREKNQCVCGQDITNHSCHLRHTSYDTHMTVSKCESLHADGAVSLGPLSTWQSQRVFWLLAKIAGLLC